MPQCMDYFIWQVVFEIACRIYIIQFKEIFEKILLPEDVG